MEKNGGIEKTLSAAAAEPSGFWRVVVAVCSRPKYFSQVAKFPLIKALGHLVALALICAIAITVGRMRELHLRLNVVSESLAKEFGTLRVADDKLLPTVEPERPRELLLTRGAGLSYLPKPDDELGFLKNDNIHRGLVWTPDLIFGWSRVGKDRYFFQPLTLGATARGLFSPSIEADEIRRRVAEGGNMGLNLSGEYSFRGVAAATMVVATPFNLLAFFALISFLSLAYALMTTFVYRVFNRPVEGKGLGGNSRGLLVIAIYAGFPGIIIGSFFPMLSLPFLDYQTVFLVGFLVYFFTIAGQIEKKRQPAKEEPVDFDF